MTATPSLRARLTLIILVPLMIIALAVGYWAATDAQTRAAERFDRSLLSTTLAITRDTALSGGDALRSTTRDLLRDTSGGPVFYHVYAPDGVFVTGYATPPVPPPEVIRQGPSQVYYDGDYQGQPVRVLRFIDAMSVDGLTGDFTFTVWQNIALRDGFVRDLSRRTFTVISTLLVALFLIVWFGVRLGLRPLLGLQQAIGQRTPTDLAPIRRPVPIEARGIVDTLNALLRALTDTIRAKDDFISNAAHQLRNPIAGVLAMSEAVASAQTMQAVRARSADLVEAAGQASDLANALLAFERARSLHSPDALRVIDLVGLCDTVYRAARQGFDDRGFNNRGVDLTLTVPDAPVPMTAEPMLLEQALSNLLDNALKHAGAGLSRVEMVLEASATEIRISVIDDGVGLTAEQAAIALERFGQVSPRAGSGIGLSIVTAVAEGLGGRFDLLGTATGLTARLVFPRTAATPDAS